MLEVANYNQYVYLYTGFGEPDDIVDDGCEKWTHKIEKTFIRQI